MLQTVTIIPISSWIGAAVVGGVGTAVVLPTAGSDIHLPRGTTFPATLEDAVDVRLPIAR